jgi:phosphorylcholine metabolism protein LicD
LVTKTQVINRQLVEELYPDIRKSGETTLQQCQLVLIRMLKIVDYVCTAHGISYWMTAGTLIGAIRHKGMIPWDADIDLGIAESDLQKLTTVLELFPTSMFYQDHNTDPRYPKSSSVVKFRDRYSNYVEYEEAHPEVTWHNGLQLDFLIYHENNAGQLVNPIRGTAYDRREIFPLTTLVFEGSQLKAPRNWHSYISRRYGNYMQLPPLGQRIPHEGRADPIRACDHPASLDFQDSGTY